MKYILRICFEANHAPVETFESSSPFASISKGDFLSTTGWNAALPMRERLQVLEVEHGLVQGLPGNETQIITLLVELKRRE